MSKISLVTMQGNQPCMAGEPILNPSLKGRTFALPVPNTLPFTGEELCSIGLPVAVRRTLLGVGLISNSLGDTQVRQEVLPQKFFGMYLLH